MHVVGKLLAAETKITDEEAVRRVMHALTMSRMMQTQSWCLRSQSQACQEAAWNFASR